MRSFCRKMYDIRGVQGDDWINERYVVSYMELAGQRKTAIGTVDDCLQNLPSI